LKRHEIICNICGKIFDQWDEQEDFGLHCNVGYGSTYDGDLIDLDMCCDCFDKLIDDLRPKCVIDPITERF